MIIFTVSKNMSFNEVSEMVGWCMDNCTGHFYLSPFAILNPLSIIYQSYIKIKWPEFQANWAACSNETFSVFGFPTYIFFDDTSDATFFKLSFDPSNVCFLCESMI